MMREFVVHGEPQGKARARVVNGHAYTPEKTLNYEDAIRWSYMDKHRDAPMFAQGVPVSVTIYADMRIPTSAAHCKQDAMRRQETRPTKKPDWDNIGKVICDALNGLAWYDDTQVVEAYVIKRYADIPMVRVMIDEA